MVMVRFSRGGTYGPRPCPWHDHIWACAWGLDATGKRGQEVLHRGTVRREGLQEGAV